MSPKLMEPKANLSLMGELTPCPKGHGVIWSRSRTKARDLWLGGGENIYLPALDYFSQKRGGADRN